MHLELEDAGFTGEHERGVEIEPEEVDVGRIQCLGEVAGGVDVERRNGVGGAVPPVGDVTPASVSVVVPTCNFTASAPASACKCSPPKAKVNVPTVKVLSLRSTSIAPPLEIENVGTVRLPICSKPARCWTC